MAIEPAGARAPIIDLTTTITASRGLTRLLAAIPEDHWRRSPESVERLVLRWADLMDVVMDELVTPALLR